MGKRLYKRFVIGETLRDTLRRIPESERLRFYEMVTDYGLDGIEPELSGLEWAVWFQMKTLIDEE